MSLSKSQSNCSNPSAVWKFTDRGIEGKEYRSLKATDDVLTITLERALAILAEPKAVRGGKKEPLRTIGNHPDDNEPVAIFSGPRGANL